MLLAHPGIDPNVELDHHMTISRFLSSDDSKVSLDTVTDGRVLCTPLFLAASHGYDQVIKSLVDDPDIDINWKEEQSGSTALIEAVRGRHRHVVRHILRHHNVDVNQKDSNGASALSIAAWEGYCEMVRMLIKHPNIDVNVMIDGYTPYILALGKGHESIVKILERHPDTSLLIL